MMVYVYENHLPKTEKEWYATYTKLISHLGVFIFVLYEILPRRARPLEKSVAFDDAGMEQCSNDGGQGQGMRIVLVGILVRSSVAMATVRGLLIIKYHNAHKLDCFE